MNTETAPAPVAQPARSPTDSRRLMGLLFATGLTSMGVEVVWVRFFTPFSGTVVYAFAGILCVYMAATYAGSQAYRRSGAHSHPLSGSWLSLLGFTVLLPVIACNTRWPMPPLAPRAGAAFSWYTASANCSMRLSA